MANPIITKIQIEGNDVVSFLNGTDYVRAMSQILPQSPTYISYRYDSITISQVAGDAFTFSIYAITDVGGISFAALSLQDPADIVEAKTIEVYRLLVTSIFKGCCECGNTEPECSIQYKYDEDPTLLGTFAYDGTTISFNYTTGNNQDFTGFFPIVQDGSWAFLFSKTDPTIYAVIQLSNFVDQTTHAQFDVVELNAQGTPFVVQTEFCIDFTSVGGSLVQDWQDTLNISSLLTQDNTIDGGGFTFTWNNVLKYITQSTNYQQYQSNDGLGGIGEVKIDPGAVTISGTGYIDIITPGYPSASTGWVLALDASGHVEYVEAGTGTISSIELVMPPAFTVSDPNPLTTNGTFTVTVDGTEDQYINGLGELATFPVYTVENGLHAFGGVPGEAPADPYLFHLGGELVENTTITVTNGANEYALGISGLANQDTQQPFGVSNLGNGGVATFQDYGSGARSNPSVEIVGDADLIQPLLQLTLEGNYSSSNDTLLRLNYTGNPTTATSTIDYQFRNNDPVVANSSFVASRLTTEITNFANNSEQAKFELQLINSGTLANKLEMSGTGQLTLNEYGTQFTNAAPTFGLVVDSNGLVWKKSLGGGGTVQSVSATGLLTTSPDPITVTGTVTSQMASGFLVGRYSAGTGVFEQITVGSGLNLSGAGVLTADGSIPAFDGDQGVYKDTTLANDTFMLGAPYGSGSTIAFQEDREVNTDAYTLFIQGTPDADFFVTQIINQGAGSGLYAEADSAFQAAVSGYSAAGIGVYGSANNAGSYGLSAYNKFGTGTYTFSSNSYALEASSDNYIPVLIRRNPGALINSPIDIIEFKASAMTTGGGVSSVTYLNTTQASKVITKWTTIDDVSQYEIQTKPTGGSLATNLAIKGTGQLQLNKYITSTSFQSASGSSVGVLNVDNAGNVFVGTGGGPSTTYDSNQGIYRDASGSPELFQLGAPSGSQGGIAFSIDRFIDTTDKSLQMEGSATILKTIQNSAAPISTDGTFLSTASAGGSSYAGVFTGYEFAALLAYSVGVDSYALEVTNAGTGANSVAATFQCDAGGGIKVLSGSNSIFQINGGSSVTPAIYPALDLENLSNLTTPANGEGVSITMSPGTDAFGAIDVGVSLNAVISDIGTPAGGDSVVDFRVDTLNSGTVQQHTSFIGTGQLQLHEYTTSTSFAAASGASVGVLNVDNAGKVFVGGGGTYTVSNGLYEDPANNFKLGGNPLVEDTEIDGDGNQWGFSFTNLDQFGVNTDYKISFQALDGTNDSNISIQTNQIDIGAGVTGSGSSAFSKFTTTKATLGFVTPGGNLEISADATTLNVKTPDVRSATATVGQVLTLQNATTGEVEFQDAGGGLRSGTASGTNAYTVTISGVTGYADGDTYAIKFTNGNDDDSTIDINGLGVKNLFKQANIQVTGGDIVSGQELIIIYDGTQFQCIGVAPNQLFAYVTNADSATINKGQPVYAFGSAGNRMSVKLASNLQDSTSAQTVGVVFSSSIAAGQKGFIITQGVITGVNTAAYSPGDQLYLGATPGTYASPGTKPFAPNHLVYIGIVERANAGNGQIYVRTQNGYELDELHDVDLISTPPSNNNVIRYNSTTDLWVPATVPSLSGTFSIGITVDGSGGVITAGQKGYVRVPYACTITSWSILTGNAGSGATVTFDIWRANNAIPTVANTIVGAGTKPFLTNNTAQITSAAPSGWTSVALAANDILGFNVETGAAVFSWANLQLLVTKS
jgi:hypothetical protein